MAHDYADKIAKLLAMAERAENENMAANYLSKASELQLQMMLTDEDIRRAAGSKNVTEEFIQRPVVGLNKNGNYVKARRELAYGLASIYNVKVTIYSDRPAVILYGFESDVAFVQQMYTSLVGQLASHMEAAWMDADSEYPYYRPANKRTWTTSFAHGYVARVVDRLRTARAGQEKTADTVNPGAAMVVRNRAQVVTGKFNDRMGGRKLKASYKNTSIRSQDGLVAGYAAGNRADIGNTRIGGTRGQIND